MRKSFRIATIASAILFLGVLCIFARTVFVADDWARSVWSRGHSEYERRDIIFAEGAFVYSHTIEAYPSEESQPNDRGAGWSHESFQLDGSVGEWLAAHGLFDSETIWSTMWDLTPTGHLFLGLCIRIWLWPLFILFGLLPAVWLRPMIWGRLRERLSRKSQKTALPIN